MKTKQLRSRLGIVTRARQDVRESVSGLNFASERSCRRAPAPHARAAITHGSRRGTSVVRDTGLRDGRGRIENKTETRKYIISATVVRTVITR
ncbi:hypothetical protein EVAR_100365_1 [Eumeta japonica]|uniref:Uncharacterized protein n=1 Tax=Eumeta variegata TaxID=151549 RepID=A0A4C2A5T4_EUMVA|nr:hypothetical protein EVAR_100365_1 [Eumeta japonica]